MFKKIILLAAIVLLNVNSFGTITNTLTLHFQDAYDFSEQLFWPFSTETTDFSYLPDNTGLEPVEWRGCFLALDTFQPGIVDIGSVPLLDIDYIPQDGYSDFVDAIVGHSYVAMAHESEADFYIFFNVTNVQPDSVTFDWIYSDVAPVPEPATLIFLGLGGLVLRRRRQ